MISFALFAALLSPAAASLVLRLNATGWEKPAIKHRLRVCNAYPSSHALRVLKNNEEFMGKSQMKYKECTELKGTLNEGDRLNFQADDSIPLSTFTVNDLPKEQSTLLLVVYRESKDSAKIAFKSHIFTVSKEAQLAVIDTFQGETKAKLSISEFRCNRHSTGSAPALHPYEVQHSHGIRIWNLRGQDYFWCQDTFGGTFQRGRWRGLCCVANRT